MLRLIVLLILIGRISSISRGKEVKIKNYPWMVSLWKNKRYFCGGTLISNQWILTVAHCSTPRTVLYGTDSLRYGGKRAKVKQVIRHFGFDPKSLANDIALIQLNRPIKFSQNVKAVKLPKRNFEVKGHFETEVVLAGFGDDEHGNSPEFLQAARLLVTSRKYCSKLYDRYKVRNTQICAATRYGLGLECSGDSGSPLTLKNGTLVGIVSFGSDTCLKGSGVYTKISSFMDWISKITKIRF